MNKIKKCLLTVWQVMFIIGLVLMGEFYLLDKYTGNGEEFLRFLRVLKIIEDKYNGEIDKEELFQGATSGMVKAVGDPYTAYLDKKGFRSLSEATNGSFGGIGIVYGKRGGKYVVISALEDGPSAKAGVKSGDVIVSVNGEATSDMDMEEVSTKIRGKIGTEVNIELQYKDEAPRKIRIIRKEIKNPSVAGKLLDNTDIGYIRISMFNSNTGKDFKKIYQELEGKGMKATLLDLRGNPGGTLSDGVAVAGMLVPKGPIVSVTDKHGKTYTENSNLAKVKYPLAILVDGGTASAAEIVSGAVKDTKSGKLFGVKTFGKGSVQSVIYLGNESAVKVTTAKYYTPSGVSIHNKGIEPDVVVELPENATFDNQLDAAKKYLLEELQK